VKTNLQVKSELKRFGDVDDGKKIKPAISLRLV
jgi:hypothetical protein